MAAITVSNFTEFMVAAPCVRCGNGPKVQDKQFCKACMRTRAFADWFIQRIAVYRTWPTTGRDMDGVAWSFARNFNHAVNSFCNDVTAPVASRMRQCTTWDQVIAVINQSKDEIMA